MSGVTTVTVSADDADIRLDRWFQRHFPGLSHGRLEKLLRTGQVRVDGKRAKAGLRLIEGQTIRVPPTGQGQGEGVPTPPRRERPAVSEEDAEWVRSLVLMRDAQVIAINKPAGLAVQGGSGTRRHLDGMLDALRFDARERPRLVHRLDKDTSGVLLLGRSAAAASKLAEAFRSRETRKTYWALVAGVPRPEKGRIDMALAKRAAARGERMARDDEEGKHAVTYYAVVEAAAKRAAWLALRPITGRTHQLRAHCAAIGTPIVGDGKYGGSDAFLPGLPEARQLHLHARAIEMPHPAGGTLHVTAPLTGGMRETWRFLGFDLEDDGNPFAALEI